MKRWLSICRCPTHRDFWSISIDDEHGGTRLAGSKCCGRWTIVKQFLVTPEQLHEICNELECEAELMESERSA
jgi:hypothetical protein